MVAAEPTTTTVSTADSVWWNNALLSYREKEIEFDRMKKCCKLERRVGNAPKLYMFVWSFVLLHSLSCTPNGTLKLHHRYALCAHYPEYILFGFDKHLLAAWKAIFIDAIFICISGTTQFIVCRHAPPYILGLDDAHATTPLCVHCSVLRRFIHIGIDSDIIIIVTCTCKLQAATCCTPRRVRLSFCGETGIAFR